MEKSWSIIYAGERTFHECEGRLFDPSRTIEFDPITLEEIKKEVIEEAKESVTITEEPKPETETVIEPSTVPVIEEPFTCDVCGKTAKSNAGLSAHKRKSHKE